MLENFREKVQFRRAFITGLVALFPIAVTAFLLNLVWDMAIARLSNPVGRAITFLVSWSTGLDYAAVPQWPGKIAALVIAVLFIYALGRSLTCLFGRRMMDLTDSIFSRLPVVRFIYPHAKQLSDFLFGARKVKFNRVVAIEYPRKGIYTIGFVTSGGIEKLSTKLGRRMLAVFVPTSPTPFTGWTVLVDEDEVTPIDMSVDQAVRFAVSCGVIVPGAMVAGELPNGAPQLKAAGADPEADAS